MRGAWRGVGSSTRGARAARRQCRGRRFRNHHEPRTMAPTTHRTHAQPGGLGECLRLIKREPAPHAEHRIVTHRCRTTERHDMRTGNPRAVADQVVPHHRTARHASHLVQGVHHVCIGKVMEHQRCMRHVARPLPHRRRRGTDIHAREPQSRGSAVGGGNRQDVLAPIGSQPLRVPTASRGGAQERAPDVTGACAEIHHRDTVAAHGPHHAVHGTLHRRRRRRPPVQSPQQAELGGQHPRIGRCRVHQLCAGSAGRGREGGHREAGKLPGSTVRITLRA